MLSVEIKQDYKALSNAVDGAVERLEEFLAEFSVYDMPEIEKCIQGLKDARQLAEKMYMNAAHKK